MFLKGEKIHSSGIGKVMKLQIKKILRCHVLLVALGCGLLFPALSGFGAAGKAKNPDLPKIIQVLTRPQGNVLVVTTDRSGLFVSNSEGKKWRRAAPAPDTYIYKAAVDSEGAVYLCTAQGLFRSSDLQSWALLRKGVFTEAAFDPAGKTALIRAWNQPFTPVNLKKGHWGDQQEAQAFSTNRSRLKKETDELRQKYLTLMKSQASRESRTEALKEWQKAQNKLRNFDRKSRQKNWKTAAGLPKKTTTMAVFLPEAGWFASAFGHGVFRLQAEDQKWVPASSGLPGPWVLQIAVSSRGKMYAGTYGAGLHVWDEKKALWQDLGPHFTGTIIEDMAFGPHGECLIATRNQGLRFSLDQGQTWEKAHRFPAAASPRSVAISRDGSFWAGTWERGLYLSTDRGTTWHSRPFAYTTHVAALAFAADGAGYALIAGRGLFLTTDNGRTWSAQTIPISPSRQTSLTVDPAGKIYLGSPREGVWMSANNGRDWRSIRRGLPKEKGVAALLTHPRGTVLAAPCQDKGLYALTEGDRWKPWPAALAKKKRSYFTRLMFLPDGRTLLAESRFLFLSEDGGTNWEDNFFTETFEGLAVDRRGTLYVRGFMNTFALHLNAERWHRPPDIPGEAFGFFHPLDEKTWLGARYGGGISRLEVQDGQLVETSQALPGKQVDHLATAADGTVFAGLEEGLMASRDKGRSWRPVSLGED